MYSIGKKVFRGIREYIFFSLHIKELKVMTKLFKNILMIVCVVFLALTSVFFVIGIENSKVEAAEEHQYNFVKSVSGLGHVVALTADGEVYAWGLNDCNQVNGSTEKYIKEPVRIAHTYGNKAFDIAATEKSSALVNEQGEVYTWGAGGEENAYQNGSKLSRNVSEPSVMTVSDKGSIKVNMSGVTESMIGTYNLISGGSKHYAVSNSSSATVDDGEIVVWGDNRSGQCTGKVDHSMPYVMQPLRVSALTGKYPYTYAHGDTTYAVKKDSANYTILAFGAGVGQDQSFGAVLNITKLAAIPKIAGGKNVMAYIDGTKLTIYRNGVDKQTIENVKDVEITGNDTIAVIMGANSGLDGKVYTFGADNYGLAGVIPGEDFANKKQIHFQGDSVNDFKAVRLGNGTDCFFMVDTNGRLHIFGDRSTEEKLAKFPATVADVETPVDSLSVNYSYVYNFVHGEENTAITGQTRLIYVNRDGNFSDVEKPSYGSSSYVFSLDENAQNVIFSQTLNELGKEEAGLTVKDKFMIPETDTIVTRYGAVKVGDIHITSTTDTSLDSADYSKVLQVKLSADGKTMTVTGNMKIVKDATVTLRVPIVEYVYNGVSDSGECMDAVGVYYVNLVFGFDNWKPVAVTDQQARTFHGDVNARIDNTSDGNMKYTNGAEDYSYKERTFVSSDLVMDYDNNNADANGGMNNWPKSLMFKANSFVYSGGITDENVSVELSEDGCEARVIAHKSFSGDATITVTVVDDYQAEAQVVILVGAVARSSSVIDKTLFADGVQASIANIISISDLLPDAGDMLFDESSLQYNKNIASVTLDESGTSIRIESNKSGDTRLSGTIYSASAADDKSQFEVTLRFAGNKAPTRIDNKIFNIRSFAEITYTADELFSDPENGEMTMRIISQGTVGVVALTLAQDNRALVVKPKKQGTDKVVIAVTDGVSGIIPYTFTFTISNAYITSDVKIGIDDQVLFASYLAMFVSGYRAEEISAAKFSTDLADKENEIVGIAVSEDKSYVTLSPKKKGKYDLAVSLTIGTSSDVIVEVPIRVESFLNPTKYIVFDVASAGKNMQLSIDTLIEQLAIVDESGTPLSANSYRFIDVHYKGSENYVTAYVHANGTSLAMSAIMNTPEFTPTENMQVVEIGSEGGFVQYLYTDLEYRSTGEVFSVVIPVVVTGLKLFPTNGEYRTILFVSLAAALFVVFIIIFINFRINVSKRNKYKREIEKVKVKNKLKKAQAMGANKQQSMSVALGKSKMPFGKQMPGGGASTIKPSMMGQPRMPSPGMMPNPGMAPSASMMNNANSSMSMTAAGINPQMSMMNRPAGAQSMTPNMNPNMMPNMAQSMTPNMNPNMNADMPPNVAPNMNMMPNMAQDVNQNIAQPFNASPETGSEAEVEVINLGDDEPTGDQAQNVSFMPNFQNGQPAQAADSGDALALDGEGGIPVMTEMPPLKAQQNVGQNARDEIEEKIQARLKAEQEAMNQGVQMPDPQPFETEPKMSKKEKKKQEMLQKLREKMNKGK